jgi:hypothetical protein
MIENTQEINSEHNGNETPALHRAYNRESEYCRSIGRPAPSRDNYMRQSLREAVANQLKNYGKFV